MIKVHINLGDPVHTNLDFVVLANGHRLDIVFAPQLFGQRRRHDPASDMGRSGEMFLARLASRRRFVHVELHIASGTENKTISAPKANEFDH